MRFTESLVKPASEVVCLRILVVDGLWIEKVNGVLTFFSMDEAEACRPDSLMHCRIAHGSHLRQDQIPSSRVFSAILADRISYYPV